MKQVILRTTLAVLLMCLFGFLTTGCYTYDVNGEAPVRYANSVQIIPYDSVKRLPAKSIQIFDSPNQIQMPYHVVALLMRSGKPNDQALILKALIWRARHEGADGVILLGVQNFGGQDGVIFGNRNGIYGTSSPTEPVFRAQAIVFDKPTGSP
jgi:hypothetical protein